LGGKSSATTRGEGCDAAQIVPRGEYAGNQLPSSYWTRRLLAAGFTVDECMAIRGLSREIVMQHAGQRE